MQSGQSNSGVEHVPAEDKSSATVQRVRWMQNNATFEIRPALELVPGYTEVFLGDMGGAAVLQFYATPPTNVRESHLVGTSNRILI